jgi:prepilin-type processing-associated H-X9-DG protein
LESQGPFRPLAADPPLSRALEIGDVQHAVTAFTRADEAEPTEIVLSVWEFLDETVGQFLAGMLEPGDGGHRTNAALVAGKVRAPPFAVLERRWFDFLSKYVLGRGKELNPNGDGYSAAPTTLWIGSNEIMNGNNVIWGCPTWRRMTKVGASDPQVATQHPGYVMNFFPFAPDDLQPSGNYIVDRKKLAFRNWAGSTNPADPAAIPGNAFKQVQWRRAAERCLLFDSVHPIWTVSFSTGTDYATKWPFEPETATPFPAQPDGGTFTLDFNRHAKRNLGNKPNDPSMNVLYCDGHADFVSCREAYRSIRFK